MAGPQNVIVGDDANYGLDLPDTKNTEDDLSDLKKAAKFSKSAEFKALKQHLEQRIDFYQTYLPNGEAVSNKLKKDIEAHWVIANTIIAEFKAVLSAYEQAAQQIKDELAKRKTA